MLDDQDPTELIELLPRVKYKNWKFDVQKVSRYYSAWRMSITFTCPDSKTKCADILLMHNFPVPPSLVLAGGDWKIWLMECIFLVEKHEAMEEFEVDGFKTFYPDHEPIFGDPYLLKEKVP